MPAGGPPDPRRGRTAALVGAAVLLAGSVGGGAALLLAGDERDALVAAAPSTTGTPSPQDDSPAPTPAPTPTATPTPTAVPTPTATPELPRTAPPEHGAARAAVYLAVAYDGADPELERAEAQAAAAGYDAATGDVSCDQGAREALDLDPERDYVVVALYFADRPTAQRFVDLYEPGVVGIADVTTYCLD